MLSFETAIAEQILSLIKRATAIVILNLPR